MKRILITGVSGLLGSNLAFCWRDQYEICGVFHKHPWSFDGIVTKNVDLNDRAAVDVLLKDFSPDIVVHAAAMADVDQCEQDPQAAFCANVEMTRNLVQAVDQNVKFVYISTDLVYDGVCGGYIESDPVALINIYAKTKYQGEQEVLCLPEALIVRTNFFGWNVGNKVCFAERVLKEAQDQTMKGFIDSYFSSLYTFDLAKMLDCAFGKNLSGVYHFASSTAMSRYNFADTLAQKSGLGRDLIIPSSIIDYSFKAKRALNLSLKTDKLSAGIGMSILTAQESIEHFVRDYQKEIGLKLKGEVS